MNSLCQIYTRNWQWSVYKIGTDAIISALGKEMKHEMYTQGKSQKALTSHRMSQSCRLYFVSKALSRRNHSLIICHYDGGQLLLKQSVCRKLHIAAWAKCRRGLSTKNVISLLLYEPNIQTLLLTLKDCAIGAKKMVLETVLNDQYYMT